MWLSTAGHSTPWEGRRTEGKAGLGCAFPLQHFKLLAEQMGKRTRQLRPTPIKHVPTEFHILTYTQKMFFWDKGWKLAFGWTLVSHSSDWRLSGYKVQQIKKLHASSEVLTAAKPKRSGKNQRLTRFFHTAWERRGHPHCFTGCKMAGERLEEGSGAAWEL